ncbi:hypothetical protein Micbo1qcDRAFT_230276 [Microdochium bolleyi]|uniref:DUF924-domain-containing protein n=1 Tax=Microdochium bolleyi TaxID=196109 RepID=A0A136JKN8_9PEZI|nr:hypothetical protein Micbo1qcDRAFT_230276 [Microdochium bolleyi]
MIPLRARATALAAHSSPSSAVIASRATAPRAAYFFRSPAGTVTLAAASTAPRGLSSAAPSVRPRPYSSSTTGTTTPTATMDPRATEVLEYWFSLGPQTWFQSASEAQDAEIRTRFGALVHEARTDPALERSWTAEPESTLALLLLLDQFPRNIFRGSGESFASDPQACRIAVAAIARGFDRAMTSPSRISNELSSTEVPYLRRMFFYLPLMHAEDLTAQVACCALYETLERECPDGRPEKEHIRTEFAARHRDCILLHGRFPKRNDWLGREHTEEERRFLEEKPMGF